MQQPVLGPQGCKSRIADADQQIAPNSKPPLPRGKLITLLPAIERAKRRSRLLRSLPPRQPTSRDLGKIAAQAQADNGETERNPNDPSDEIATHGPNISAAGEVPLRGFEPRFRTENRRLPSAEAISQSRR